VLARLTVFYLLVLLENKRTRTERSPILTYVKVLSGEKRFGENLLSESFFWFFELLVSAKHQRCRRLAQNQGILTEGEGSDLLVPTSLCQLLFKAKLCFTFFSKLANLMRRLTVLSFPPRLVIPAQNSFLFYFSAEETATKTKNISFRCY
jgi:hypothetical protein